MEAIQAELISLFIAIITALAGIVTRKVVSYLDKKGVISQLESNQELVRIVVNAVEQAYQELNGEQKFNLAKHRLVSIMNENKVKITEEELDLMIESIVKEMNDSAKSELNK